MIAVIPFFSALVLLAGFIAFHAWELKQGKRLFGAYRTELDEKVSHFYQALVTSDIPTSWRLAVLHFFHVIAHSIVVISVEVLRAVEQPLSRLSHRMRTRPPAASTDEVSQYLKNIVPDKKGNAGNDTTPAGGV
jgi:hypothetical protein